MIRRGFFSISLEQNFLESLVVGILKEVSKNPLELREYTIFLPTRRAIRELKKLFLKLYEGSSLMLPKMIALGEFSEEELGLPDFSQTPELPAFKRQVMLAKLIKAFGGQGYDMSSSQAFKLASDLMGLIDQVILEDLDLNSLQTLVSENYAEHWQITLNFLEIITHHWPKILEEEGYVEPALARRRAIENLLKTWRKSPPKTPYILAGSTGSMKLTRALMKGILNLPSGRVILPGFRNQDYELALRYPTHPQHTLSVTVKACGEEVKEWGMRKSLSNNGVSIVSQALRPELKALSLDETLKNGHRIDCSSEMEEASVIALILREAVESETKTSMLVTPDRTLARRVASQLRRWDIQVDDSSGRPLSETPVGILTRLTAEFFANPNDLSVLLSLLKHPLTRFGLEASEIRTLVRTCEKTYLRGEVFGDNSLQELVNKIEFPNLKQLIERLYEASSQFFSEFKNTFLDFGKVLPLHKEFLTMITTTDEGEVLIFRKEEGRQLNSLLEDFYENSSFLPAMEPVEYASLLTLMMSAVSIRNKTPTHPRILILGPLEARLMTADRVILAGLNEGTWPMEPETGPWLSRPMRSDFGLQPLEQRIGLSAHDFTKAFAAEEVFLTRSSKLGGTPTIPCRWLLRLETLLDSSAWLDKAPFYLQWANTLDTPREFVKLAPPEPKPPVHMRPKHLSVTQVETWMRDPYEIFARHILDLKKMDPLALEPTVADRGSIIHKCLERFKKEDKSTLDDLLKIGSQEFKPLSHSPFVSQFWWPRFVRIAEWFVEEDTKQSSYKTYTEAKGEVKFGSFTLSAKADRIDIQGDETLIIDYKTGSLPTEKSVKFGYSCQLPLEGVILKHNGFGINAHSIGLQYWALSGRDLAGEVKELKEVDTLIESAESGLKELISQFEKAGTPYRSQPRPEWKPAYSDYDHLARTQEWARG